MEKQPLDGYPILRAIVIGFLSAVFIGCFIAVFFVGGCAPLREAQEPTLQLQYDPELDRAMLELRAAGSPGPKGAVVRNTNAH